jgi:hypothetical protein
MNIPTCYFCTEAIEKGDEVNLHHPVYKSNGGKSTEPAHKGCHVEFHSTEGDFKQWGRIGGQISALSRQWAFNLKNVREHPAYEVDRAFYLAMYSH